MLQSETRTQPPAAERPIGADELVAKARRMLALCDIEGYLEATPLFREAIESAPDHAPAYAGLAETYAYWGFRREITGQECQSLYAMSREYAAIALRLGPERGEAHRAVAISLRRGEKADPVRRKEEARAALELSPDQAETWHENWRIRGYDPEDPYILKALELDPELCGLRIDLGAALCESERYQESLNEFAAAIRINPRNSLAHYDLAMVLDRMGQRLKAQEFMRKALRLHPQEPLIEIGLEFLGR